MLWSFCLHCSSHTVIIYFRFHVIWLCLGSINMPVTRLHSALSSHVRSEKRTPQSHPVSSPTRIANWPEGLPSKNVSSCGSAQRWCRNCWYHSQGIFLKLVNHFTTLNKGTVVVFGYLILIGIYFYRFYFSIFSLVFVSIEEIYQTLKSVLEHFKHPEALQNYSWVLIVMIFNSLLSDWKCYHTRPFMFDVLYYIKLKKQRFIGVSKRREVIWN